MPVNFLTATQRERYCNYPEELSPDEIARHFHLDDADLVWIATKRRDSSRLGYALQLRTVRFLGAFLDDPTAVPAPVLKAIAKQIGVTGVPLFLVQFWTFQDRPLARLPKA